MDVRDGPSSIEWLSFVNSNDWLCPVFVEDGIGWEPSRWFRYRVIPDSQQKLLLVDFFELPDLAIRLEQFRNDHDWIDPNVFTLGEHLVNFE